MEQKKETVSRQMQLMLEPAQERLKKYSIEELCRKGAVQYEAATEEFVIPSLGKDVRVHWPEFEADRAEDMWQYLTLLQYMDTADGSPLSGSWIGLPQMTGGLSRGEGFNREISAMAERSLTAADRNAVREACLQLGGEIVPGRADVSAVIRFAPRFPVLFNFWEGDDEFPPSVKTLVDSQAEHYLTLEAAGGVCLAVVQGIVAGYEASR